MVRRSSRFLAHLIGGLLAALALGAGALGVRLSQGPLSLDFLTPYVQQALADVVPEYRVAVGGTRLIWGGFEESLDIEVTDDGDGEQKPVGFRSPRRHPDAAHPPGGRSRRSLWVAWRSRSVAMRV